MDERITLTVTRTEGDTTNPQGTNYNSTTTINAANLDELQRMLQLAGLKDDDGKAIANNTAATTTVVVPRATDIQDAEYEVVNGDCNCADDCPGCACCEGEPTVEGWLEKNMTNGAVEVNAHGPEDMLDISFDTEMETLGENADHDYGHTDQSPHKNYNEISAFDYKGRPEGGRTQFRYVQAQMADNPMAMDEEDEFDVTTDDQPDPISDEVNAVCELIKSDIDAGNFHDVGDYLDELIDLGLDPQEARQEVIDQYVLLYDRSPEPTTAAFAESASHLKESIGILVENTSDVFMNALDKIREGRVNALSDAEISHCAAAFINLMRQTDTARVQRLHECMSEFVNNNGLETEYAKYLAKR